MQDTDLPFTDEIETPQQEAPQAEQPWSTYPAIVADLDAATYHRHPAVSKHGLDAFRKAPAYYQWQRANHKAPTPAMSFGSLYHTVVLEPETLTQLYAVVPEDAPKRPTRVQREAAKPSLSTIEAIAWWEDFERATSGKQIMDQGEINKCHAMRAALLRNKAAANALEERLYTEASLFWLDGQTGVQCRARPDIIRADGLVVDVKTCADASPDAFQRAAWNFGYYRQAAYYLHALETITGERPKAFVFVAQETEPPYLNAVYVASPTMIEVGMGEIREDLRRFAKCLQTGVWPGLPEAPQELTIPAWAMPKQA